MNDRCIPSQDVVGRVDTTFTDLDQQRTQGLEQLQQIQTVQNAALVREQQRLIAKYGEDHPRVQNATTRLTYNQGLQRDLSQEVERSKIDVPQLDRSTWKGHGFVLNKDLVGIQGLTISFVDAQGNWIRELGYACTDERGYFSILYPKQPTQPPAKSDFPPIFLTVTDTNQRVLHRESTSRTVNLGLVDFWRIVLGADNGGTCEPPNPDNPPTGKAVQVQSLDAPEQLTVNQVGSFRAKVNDDATPPVTSCWEFGDGTTADGLTVTHAYANPGSYTVTFTASNTAGKDARTSQLRVQDVPNPPQIGDIKVVPEKPTTRTPVQFTAAETGTQSLQLTVNKPETATWTVGGQVFLNAA
jgi:hypothetical protein